MNADSKFSRRRFLGLMAGTAGLGLIPGLAWTDDDGDDDDDGESYANSGANSNFALADTGLNANIVVIGGGMAGATTAKYLRLWGGSGVKVTLVEQAASYTSNIMSNLVLNGSRTLASLDFGYGSLVSKYGVTLKQGVVTAIDKVGKTITLADGSSLAYDRLVLAPGIEFDNAWGLTQSDYAGKTPHAWQAGPQTQLLRDQIAGMGANGTFLMVIPKAPFRCPPGPYERACVVADYLKTHKSGCKVIVLDENPDIVVERENFSYAFNTLHKGVVTYFPGVTGIAINPDTRVVTFTDAGLSGRTVNASVVNPIPPQRARGSVDGLLANSGLNNGTNGRWAVVDVLKYESTAASGIHILGDAAQTTMPKAGHVANQEAKVCADAIVRLLGGQSPDSAPVTNSACYSPLTANSATWLTALYQYDPVSATMKVATPPGVVASASISNKNFKQMNVWFNTLMSDTLM